MKSKKDIRTEISAQRKALDPQWLETNSKRVTGNFQQLEVFKSSTTIALYMALGGETDLSSLFLECWKHGKHTCIPIFNAETHLYEMAKVTANTRYRLGHYGIREPIAPTLITMDQIDLMAVPGIAFDLQGQRLGRGGGYYDRLLEGFCGDTAALAFDFQILPSIPVEAHDQPVQYIVTETKLFNL